ncbi:hypothetical protein R9C00_28445 [Flammeovirgaceae bacterium SG7u.111]|nr:hypothetical protein [Flammeovirgaceae bacterium SG7u.132]WPO35632.1 hypothetical protein R9C00_28445 [Flammeovirgaceae bacterium SG7u.111]
MNRSKAQESRAAIERIYIVMRHLFNRGHYKPLGVSGQELIDALLTLSPEIYGSMGDANKVELDGMVYVVDRLPKGIEQCRFIRLISEEGYAYSDFEIIKPAKRRRNCYRIDKETMLIEVTRGRSEIYDVLTHLTFMFIESRKIMKNAFPEKGKTLREWEKLKEIVEGEVALNEENREKAFAYLSTVLGRTYDEVRAAYFRFEENRDQNKGLFEVVYRLGKLAYEEEKEENPREISFSPALKERIGHHIYGERWASEIKRTLYQKGLFERPMHIISANMHSVYNSFYAYPILKNLGMEMTIEEMTTSIKEDDSLKYQSQIKSYARSSGYYELLDSSGTNIPVQIIDTGQLDLDALSPQLGIDKKYMEKNKPVIIVMDYAFGEQAYETMDELLRPYEVEGKEIPMPVESIAIMGKAGILQGGKGDVMIPTAHVFEGTADNYPIENDVCKKDFKKLGVNVCEGTMVTVLGTSLQNKDVLSFFKNSSWQAIGLEMEGAHYQKAIQSATKIRRSIKNDLTLRYAYYASDNPLETGSTLASGSLGVAGVKPTYLITVCFLNKILGNKHRGRD